MASAHGFDSILPFSNLFDGRCLKCTRAKEAKQEQLRKYIILAQNATMSKCMDT